MLVIEPVSRLQNPVVLPTLPYEPLQVLTNGSEIIKLHGTTYVRTGTYCLINFCPNPTAEFYF